jgi:hypothetical protein
MCLELGDYLVVSNGEQIKQTFSLPKLMKFEKFIIKIFLLEMDVISLRDQRRVPVFLIPSVCVLTSLVIIIILGILTAKINSTMDEINTFLTDAQPTIPRLNAFLLTMNSMVLKVMPDLDSLVLQINKSLPVYTDTVSRMDAMVLQVMPDLDSLVLQINSSLPTYTDTISKLNFTIIQDDLTIMANKIANLTVLAYRIAALFHVI